jgi:hypothetical protein
MGPMPGQPGFMNGRPGPGGIPPNMPPNSTPFNHPGSAMLPPGGHMECPMDNLTSLVVRWAVCLRLLAGLRLR